MNRAPKCGLLECLETQLVVPSGVGILLEY